MPQAKNGDTVRVHYTGKLEDGTVFDSSTNRDPLEFTIGAGQIIPGFEEAVIGMNPGESKTTTISADKAYGPHDEDMVMVIDRNEFPERLELKVNQELQIPVQDDRTIALTVTDVSELSVTLDANHPLAGQDLTFDIQLAAIA